MKVEVKYFAALRECTGKSSEVLELNNGRVEDIFNDLNKQYSFPVDKHHLKVAVNEEYQSFESVVKDGDTLVFIPPVAGG